MSCESLHELGSGESPARGAGLESYQRSGLNSEEAAMAWAMLHFGGDLKACERLQGGVSARIREVVEPVLALDELAQFKVLERWREEDRAWDRLDGRLSDCDSPPAANPTPEDARWLRAYAMIRDAAPGRTRPWRSAHSRTRRAVEWLAIEDRRASIPIIRPELRARKGFDCVELAEMSRVELQLYIRQLGVYQLAELSHQQPRRNLVRLRQRLLAADRGWFEHCLFCSTHVDAEFRARMRKLFGGISAEGAMLVSYLLKIGLYSVAVATQSRYRHQMRHIRRELPPPYAEQLMKLEHRAAKLPVMVSAHWQVMVNDFTDQWRDYYRELRADISAPDKRANPRAFEGTDE